MGCCPPAPTPHAPSGPPLSSSSLFPCPEPSVPKLRAGPPSWQGVPHWSPQQSPVPPSPEPLGAAGIRVPLGLLPAWGTCPVCLPGRFIKTSAHGQSVCSLRSDSTSIPLCPPGPFPPGSSAADVGPQRSSAPSISQADTLRPRGVGAGCSWGAASAGRGQADWGSPPPGRPFHNTLRQQPRGLWGHWAALGERAGTRSGCPVLGDGGRH